MSLLIQKAIDDFLGVKTYWFKLPMPPSANRLWRNRKGQNKPHLNPKYVNWQKEAFHMMPRVNGENANRWEVDVRFHWYYVNETSNADLDNRLKPLVDLIKAKSGIDDRFLTRAKVEKINHKVPKQRKDHWCEVFLTLI